MVSRLLSKAVLLSHKSALLFMFLCWSLAAVAQNQDTLSAFVDRTDISLKDVITLTIRVDAIMGDNRPSLSALSQDFEQVGGISTRSNYTNNNGRVQSWTEYNIALRPRAIGTYEIPAFRIGAQSTAPITINVSEASPDAGDNNELFLRSSVSKTQLYVQEQLLYTIKIYYSIGFDQGAQLTTPQVGDAVVQQLGTDVNYQEVVNGIGYSVTERRYVIFPQSSGQLDIPPVYFSASIGRRGGINRFFNNRAQVREVNLASEAHNITVKPRPADFPGQTWLPASNLTLTEEWSGDIDNVSVGDAITRNVKLVTHGLSSSLLPGIEYKDLPGLRFYPDQPVREDAADNTGIIGTRSEGTAMVASRAGEFILPEVQMPWWNTKTNQLEIATLPARTIKVLPAAIDPTQTATSDSFTETTPQNPVMTGNTGVAGTSNSAVNILWVVATAVFACAWLATTWLWLNSRRALTYAQVTSSSGVLRMPEKGKSTSKADPGNSVKSVKASAALKVLKTACDSTNPADVRKALLKWGQALAPEQQPQTLAQLAQLCGNINLSELTKKLDATLYSPGAMNLSKEEFKTLYQEAATLHKQGLATGFKVNSDALPPLYRN